MKEAASMDQVFLDKVHEAIESNLANENFGVEELALEIGISRIHLHRKLKSLTGKSASQIIKESRLKKAMELLQNNVATSSEISYQVGFSSPSYFNTCFREYFGYSPGKVKYKRSLKKTRKHSFSRKYIIASVAAIVVLVLIVLNIMPRINRASESEIYDKSVAVLPFKCLSDDPEKQFRADGVMYEILLHLLKIEDLRVLSWTSTEQYRTTDKTATEICKELGVEYLLTGSFQKFGDRARLIVHLIQSGKEDAVWSGEYERDWKDIFTIESQVAQLVAMELKAVITPEEKQLIEKRPTNHPLAYENYQKGRVEYVKYWVDNENREALKEAEKLYNLALESDSTFAQVYVGLAQVYSYKNYWNTYWSEDFLDTAQKLADKALLFDTLLSDAYVIKGDYYRLKNRKAQAIIEYDNAIKLNPNNWAVYAGKGMMFLMDDYIQCIYNLHTATTLNRGPELPFLFRSLGITYFDAGFPDKSQYFFQEALKHDGDSVLYYRNIASVEESSSGNYEDAEISLKKGYAIDSNNVRILGSLGRLYLYQRQYEESLIYYKKYVERLDELGEKELADLAEIGYVYWKNGYKEEADYYYKEQISCCLRMNDMGRYYSHLLFSYHDLATVYAARDEKEKAYENLRIFNQNDRMPGWAVRNLKYLPLYDNIRDEPEFQQILRAVEVKHKAEHERVRQWLEENDML